MGCLTSCLVLRLPPKIKICQYQQKIHEKQKQNVSRRALFHTKTRVYLKYFGQDSRYNKLQSTHTYTNCICTCTIDESQTQSYKNKTNKKGERNIFFLIHMFLYALLFKTVMEIHFPKHQTHDIKSIQKIVNSINNSSILLQIILKLIFTNEINKTT